MKKVSKKRVARSPMIRKKGTPVVSIVIPLYNEEGNVKPLYSSLKDVMGSVGKPYEIIFVDDGSDDGTLKLLEDIQKQDESVVVLSFRRNFGQTAALVAGFDHSRGDIIVTMDGDLQNDPGDIPGLLEMLDEYDVVSGWRVNRKDPFLKRRLPSMIANWIISLVTGLKLHDYGCTLKAYRREIIENVRLYGEMHRFIPVVAKWAGARVGEIKTVHHPRRFGRSKYGMYRTVKVVLDLITIRFLQSFSTRPLHAFGVIGLISGGMGFLISLYLSFQKLIMGYDIGGRPLLLLGVLLIILGVQFIAMGLLGEILVRIYHESQGKPIYILKKVLKGKEDI